MGVAADCEYTTKYGSTSNATQAIITNWNTAGALYKVSCILSVFLAGSERNLQSTFQVSLGIVELQVHDPQCVPSHPAARCPC